MLFIVMACGGDYQMGAWVVQGGKLRGGGQVRSDEGRQDPRQVQGLTCLPTHASPPCARAPRPAPRAPRLASRDGGAHGRRRWNGADPVQHLNLNRCSVLESIRSLPSIEQKVSVEQGILHTQPHGFVWLCHVRICTYNGSYIHRYSWTKSYVDLYLAPCTNNCMYFWCRHVHIVCICTYLCCEEYLPFYSLWIKLQSNGVLI